MDRDRERPARSKLLAFRTPAQDDAPKLPPGSRGTVVRFQRKPVTPAEEPNLWRIAADLLRAERKGRY
jgi:hypothetical protein